MKIPQSKLIRAIKKDDNLGFCLACGKKATHVEPDARGYTCKHCKEPKVYGAEEILLMGAYE